MKEDDEEDLILSTEFQEMLNAMSSSEDDDEDEDEGNESETFSLPDIDENHFVDSSV